MRQLSLDHTPLTETQSTASRRVPAFMRTLSAVAICLMLCLIAASASAQNIEHTGTSADLALRSDLKINPSTHGLELQISLASYPGRAGFGLPVTYNYSSKLWRIKYGFSSPNGTTGVIALYSEHALAGWTSSLNLPAFDLEQPGNLPIYDNFGDPVSGCLPGNCYSVDRVMLRMPDGSGHEMRSRDEPFPGSSPSPLPDELYSVDGSRLRYKRLTKELFLPDGSHYILTSPTSAQYIDRHGNKLTYNNGVWTDTLGRSIQPEQSTGVEGESVLSLPGVGGVPVNYTFRRRNLSDTGVLSPGQQLSYITSNACTTGSTSPALFSTGGTECFANNYLFDPVVLHQIVLPNGQAYTFNYNSYGEVDKVIYPTGSYERYEYGRVDSASWVGDPYYQASRGVVRRFVSVGGSGTDEVESQYASASGGPLGNDQYLMSQTAPDGTRTERLMYREGNNSKFGYSVNGAKAGMDYEERVYSAAGVMLRRKLTEWAVTGSSATHQYAQNASRDPRVVREVDILLDTGGNALAATTSYQYDADLNMTSASRYDYVSVAQGTAQSGALTAFTQLGTLLRTNETTYLVNDLAIASTTRDGYRARQLLSLPTSTRVKDSAGNVVAKTAVSYDEFGAADYPLLPYTSNPSDPAAPNWEDPQTNVRGLATTASVWLNTTNTWVSVHMQYDQCGNHVKNWDANNNESQVSYSSAYKYAYPTSTTSPDPDGSGPATRLTTTTGYDFKTGKVISQTDANFQTTTMEYAPSDALGNLNLLQRLTKVSGPDGSWTAYGYNEQPGNLSVLTKTALDASRYREARQYFNNLGRSWRSVLVEDGTSVYTDTQYDLMGRVSKMSNPYRIGQTPEWTTTTYDALGRALTVTTPDTAQVLTAYGGNRVLVRDGTKKERLSQTDALGRLTEVWEITTADGATEAVSFPGHSEVTAGYRTKYAYDTLGNLTAVTQRIGAGDTTQTRSFAYDSLSRLKSAANPESGTINYEYDNNGNLTKKVDPRLLPGSNTVKIETTYTYDALNRLLRRDYNDTAMPDVIYTYDTLPNGKGRLTSVSSSVSTTSYTGYDVMGRVTGSSQSTNGQTYTFLNYSYDLAGNLTSQTYPSGRVVTYAYDDAGRLGQVNGQKAGAQQVTPYASSISYSAHSAVNALKLGNGLWEHTTYDPKRLKPTEIRLGTTQTGVNSANRLKLSYTYSETDEQGNVLNNGNVLSQTITVPTIDTAAGDPIAGFTATQSYKYDELNRLEMAQENNGASWKQTFTYDRYGNRRFDPNGTTASLIIENPTYHPSNNRINSGGYRYDAAGNLDCVPGQVCPATGPGLYEYDAENRLARVSGGADATGGASYSYDGDGRRVKKLVGGVTLKTTIFVYNAFGQLIAEYDNSGQQGAGGTSYLTADNLGTPRVITNASGLVKARHDYLPFGEEIGLSGGRTFQQGYVADDVRQTFTGYERDDETGLDYAQARYYANTQGRFTGVDPLMSSARPTNPQTWNRYSYTWNNPTNLTDPFGLEPQEGGGDFSGTGCDFDPQNGCGNGFVFTITVTAEPDLLPTTDVQTVTNLQTLTGVENPIPEHYTLQYLDWAFSDKGAATGGSLAGSVTTWGTRWGTRTPGGAAIAGSLIGAGLLGAMLRDLMKDDPTDLPIPYSPPAPSGPNMTDLYRAVNSAELMDIALNFGAFRNPAGVEVKYFSTTPAGATSYAQQTHGTGLYEGPYTLVSTQIPTNLIHPMMRATVDRGIDTIVIPSILLPALSPARIIGPIPAP